MFSNRWNNLERKTCDRIISTKHTALYKWIMVRWLFSMYIIHEYNSSGVIDCLRCSEVNQSNLLWIAYVLYVVNQANLYWFWSSWRQSYFFVMGLWNSYAGLPPCLAVCRCHDALKPYIPTRTSVSGRGTGTCLLIRLARQYTELANL